MTARHEAGSGRPDDMAGRRLPVTLWQESMEELTGLAALSDFIMSATFECEGGVDVNALRTAADELVCRHAALRNTYHRDGGRLYQRAEATRHAAVHVSAPSAAASETADEFSFALDQGPFLRASVRRHSPSHHTVTVQVHHFVADGISFDLLLAELGDLYRAIVHEVPYRDSRDRPEPADFANWQRRTVASGYADVVRQWRARLDGRRAPRWDRPRAAGTVPVPGYASRRIGRSTLHDLSAAARRSRTSLFTVAAFCYARAVHELTGDREIVFRTPFSGRDDHRFLDLVANTVNVLPVRIPITEHHANDLASVHREIGEVMRLAACPFRWIKNAVATACPDIDQLPYFGMADAPRLQLAGARTRWSPTLRGEALAVCSVFLMLDGDGAEVQCIFDSSRIEPELAESLLGAFGLGLDRFRRADAVKGER